MISYSRGDVVLVPYPFSERLSSKKRPAVVVGANPDGEAATKEVLIAQITGHMDGSAWPGDYRLAHWREAGLLRPSLVRPRLATLLTSVIIRKLGALYKEDLKAVEASLRGTLGL